MLAFIPGIFFYAYFFMTGDKVYLGFIGVVTLTIVLFNYNDVDNALLRVFNIMIGTIGALVMMRFFYPQYARDKMLATDLEIVDQLAALLKDYLDENKTLDDLKKGYLDHEHQIIVLLNVVNRYTSETKIETRHVPELITYQTNVIQHLRHLFRLCSVFVYHLTTDEIRTIPYIRTHLTKIQIELNAIQCMLDNGHNAFQPSSTMIEEKTEPQCSVDSFQTIKAVLLNMSQEAVLLRDEVKKIRSIYGRQQANES